MAGSDDERRWKIEIFKDKLRHSLGARFLLRFHASLILAFAIFTGWLCDLALLRMGLHSMALRYMLAVGGAYLAFLLGVFVWTEYSGVREYVNEYNAKFLVGDKVPREREKPSQGWSGIEGLSDLGCLAGGDGCAVVIGVILLLIVLFYFFGGYVLASASSFFSEIVLELLLAAGLLKGLNRYEGSGWMMSVWRYTWPSLVFSLVVAGLVGGVAQTNFPKAQTLPEAIKLWRR